jgi:hypothetical protein
MHNSLKIIKILLYSYSALHVPGTLAPIIRSLIILHIQPPFTVCRWVGCIFQLWTVTTRCYQMHNSLKIIKTFIECLFRSTCFGHSCAHHQEPHNSAHTASSHRVSTVCPTTNTARLSPRYEGKTRSCHCSH